MKYSKWLAKLGAIGYDGLILLNTFVNYISRLFGRGKVSLSKKIKENIKTTIKYIGNYEETAARLAIKNKYDVIVCGHIHQPEIRMIHSGDTEILYLNSGDWIENLTALEYNDNQWKIFSYYSEKNKMDDWADKEPSVETDDYSNRQLFRIMLEDISS
jgi:UDP-2,3-diacylglucosamine pyrophosphatase LpxH